MFHGVNRWVVDSCIQVPNERIAQHLLLDKVAYQLVRAADRVDDPGHDSRATNHTHRAVWQLLQLRVLHPAGPLPELEQETADDDADAAAGHGKAGHHRVHVPAERQEEVRQRRSQDEQEKREEGVAGASQRGSDECPQQRSRKSSEDDRLPIGRGQRSDTTPFRVLQVGTC